MNLMTKQWDMYDGLKDRFLYKDDLNSIHILLALYDIEENISNIFPKYSYSKDIRYKIKNILKDREDAEVISQNLSIVINEDINKLELCFYLEGYKNGYSNTKYVNLLEDKSLKLMDIQDIYRSKHLFHFQIEDESIKNLKEECSKSINNKNSRAKDIESLISMFADKVIKKKIYNLGNYVERQLKIDFDIYKFNISEVDYRLTEKEVDKIYNLVLRTLTRNVTKTYEEAFWYAINDKVIMRYS